MTKKKKPPTNLFDLAPHVCVKFRGLKSSKAAVNEVTETALTSHVAGCPLDAAPGLRVVLPVGPLRARPAET
jgi:hypothetical protein